MIDLRMTNVHAVDNRYISILNNRYLHVLVSLRMVCKRIIERDSAFLQSVTLRLIFLI